MAFPEDVLTADEDVVLHLRPHAVTVAKPVAIAVLAVAVVTGVWVVLPPNEGGRLAGWTVTAVALAVVLAKAAWPILVWRCTHWVFTNERVLLQDGVLRRDRRDLPLTKISDHGLRQGILDRLLRSGTLVIDTANEHGPTELPRVPGVVRAQTTLYALIEGAPADDEDEELGDEPEPVERPRRALPWRR
jgi:uncharacterized membrane protein YdbT with pleckstrin-like domain